MDQKSFGILAHNKIRAHNFVLVVHMSKHIRVKMAFMKMLLNFRKKGHRGIIPFVYQGKEKIHKYMQYEVPMTVCMGRIANQRKVPKC